MVDAMSFVTNFGDAAMVIPASAVLIIILTLFAGRREAAAFAVALGSCLLIIALAKLVCATCDFRSPILGIRNPSGHAALAAVFYGSVGQLLAAGRRTAMRLAIYAGAAAMIALVAASRVALHAHGVPEVVFGVLTGAAGIGVSGLWRRTSRLQLSFGPLTAALCVLAASAAFASSRAHWSADPVIDVAAAEIRAEVKICQSPQPALRTPADRR
ncbi:MAG: phosphatase PAP2 family protein [Hyphomicrobiales bacterium]|nr:phosphatase PAP2 family protein [Hyphomicrobiales bacterium]